MWRDFLGAVEGGRRPALTLTDVFADFAYMDAAYRSRASSAQNARHPAVVKPPRPPTFAEMSESCRFEVLKVHAFVAILTTNSIIIR